MNQYLEYDDWKIIEKGFNPENHLASESIFSLGNGWMGQRANFEEDYSGETLQGHYLAGVYYPDKTKVGWWKNGYPEYFAKVLNAPNWIGISIKVDGESVDLATCKTSDFLRVLNMKEGTLERSFTAILAGGKKILVKAVRFLSVEVPELGVVSYSITPLNFKGKVLAQAYLDGNIRNEDSNYDELFWEPVSHNIGLNEGYLTMKTKKLDFQVCTSMKLLVYHKDSESHPPMKYKAEPSYVSISFSQELRENEELRLVKLGAVSTTMNHPAEDLGMVNSEVLRKSADKGFEGLLEEQKQGWAEKWEVSDIVIEGDVAAQQAIRFNIFHLNQTYTGEDERLNIGPKGFTGEKYGGSTYWDTEAYCVPFYLSTASTSKVARNLLLYRYKHLQKAIENGEKLGFHSGAALFPMVTMNGEECHNEWEITFEEIHRNGAIAFAIYNYIRYTGDHAYLEDYGLEVLVAISRFWAQRVSFSEDKKQFMILGVTGPNEYENNVNNNWYTNRIASWCLEYTLDTIDAVEKSDQKKYRSLADRIKINNKEQEHWRQIIDGMYYPENQEQGIYLQQDGFLDKEQILVKDLDPSERPINQNWSWDRILRSVYIKQADVLQGLFFLEDRYSKDVIRRNFDYYEPRTVHESSLSPCIHSILAASIGYEEKAYEFYLRTARLDLDDYNNEVGEGLHITSMAGTWMAVVQGFGGMRSKNGWITFSPMIPKQWKSYSFHIRHRGSRLYLTVDKDKILVENNSQVEAHIQVFDQVIDLAGDQRIELEMK